MDVAGLGYARRARVRCRSLATRSLFAVALAVVVGAACLSCLSPQLYRSTGLAQHLSLTVVGTVVALIVRRAAVTHTSERIVWFWTSGGVAILTVGVFVNDVGALLSWAGYGREAPFTGLPLDVATLLAAPCFYRGLLRWNRFETALANPGDWLNGLSAAFALVGFGVAVRHWGGDVNAFRWQTQIWLLAVAVAFVLAGAAATTAQLGGLTRDLRVWLVTGAFAMLSAGGLIGVGRLSNGQATAWTYAGFAIAFTLIAWAASREPGASHPQNATPSAAVVGAMVVLVAGAVLLVLGNRPGYGSMTPTCYGLLAVIGGSGRGAHLLRDLAQLAHTRLEAATDDLTGIANRRALMARLRLLSRHGGAASLLIIDLDRFKDVNDSYGHHVGDELLRSVVDRLQPEVPAHGLLARLGGDEFALLLDGDQASPGQAFRVAHSVVRAASQIAEIEGRRLQVGASVGVASVDMISDDNSDLLHRADTALYAAKRSDDAVVVYDDDAHQASQDRLTRLAELRVALTSQTGEALDQIVVYYQPQVDMISGDVVGAEALVRWRNPRLGFLTPDAFLALAEEYGLMQELTAHVLRSAVAQAVRWQEAGRRIRVSVNLSASYLRHEALLPVLDEVLNDIGIDPALLTLEITETAVMTDPRRSLAVTREISARGVGISIDDYGTGRATLAYLNDLPATELKIDRSFIVRVCSDQRTSAIVGATVELAHRLNMRVIAEGVEDELTLIALRELGCDQTQGYLHSRPLPAEQFDRWITRRSAAAVDSSV